MARRCKFRQNHVRCHSNQVLLLGIVRDIRLGCRLRDPGSLNGGIDAGRNRNSLRRVQCIVDDDGAIAVALRDVLNGGRSDFAHCGCDEPSLSRGSEKRCLVQIIPIVVRREIAQQRVVFLKCDRRAVRTGDWIAGIDCVAEISGVSDVVAGCDGRGVHRRDRRIERMAVREINTVVLQFPHRGRRLWRHAHIAQAVGHEDEDIMRLARGDGGRDNRDGGGEGIGGKTHG